jgi:hypothetical protein
MRKWLTAFILIAALLGGVVGVGAHQNEGSCPLNNLPDCCKKAQSSDNAPVVSMARLCCNLNCSEPGSTGSNTTSNSSPQPRVTANAMPQAISFKGIPSTHYGQRPQKQDSNPKYIQHLALLI